MLAIINRAYRSAARAARQPDRLPMPIVDLLTETLQRKASDLHLAAGLPPMVRVHGDIVRLSQAPLRGDDVMALLQPLMTPQQAKIFGRERVSAMLGTSLTATDNDGNEIPLIATQAPSLDNGSWKLNADGSMQTIYQLRQGTTWHDGTPVTAERLSQIEALEDALHALGLRQVRVRYHGEVARIEVAQAELPRAFAEREAIDRAGKRVGFTFVALDLAGYKTGSLNQLLRVIR